MSEDRPRKRKTQNACDECHRRKVRCDGVDMPGNNCSECLSLNLPCTYNITKKKRGPKAGSSRRPPTDSVQSLIAAIISSPDSYPIPDSSDNVRALLVNLATYARDLEKELAKARRSPESNSSSSLLSDKPTPPTPSAVPALITQSSEIDVNEALANRFDNISLNEYPGRHFGQSSHFMLLRTALDMRDNLNGEPQMITIGRKNISYRDIPWHKPPEKESPNLVFPEDDLLQDLVKMYFTNMHPFFPLLHRPTFEKSIFEGLHTKDSKFGATVLAVCAIGSRYSDDPRNSYEGTTSEHSLGWKYFSQIHLLPKSFADAASLHELQLYCLAVSFLHPSFAAPQAWPLTGLAIRLAQEVGVHRKRVLDKKDPRQSQLWTRAFWQLVTFDTISSTASGRPPGTRSEDYDLDFPLECDDEYWDSPNPDQAFKQPETRPSYMSFWIHYLKLLRIVGTANRTIYAVNKVEVQTREGLSAAEWNQKSVMELDSALNEWMDSMPDHLKYDPHREDEIFSHQSLILHACYHWVQILVHKSFIPGPGQDSTSTFPSLAICANAARSCVHMIDAHLQRKHTIHSPHFLAPVFSAAVTLLTNLWKGIRQQVALDPNKEMMDVEKCLHIMNMFEKRYEIAGRLRDVLQAVLSVSQLPPMSRLSTSKRTRSPDPKLFEEGFHFEMKTDRDRPPRQLAGSRRVSSFRNRGSAMSNALQADSDEFSELSRSRPLVSSGVVDSRIPQSLGFDIGEADYRPSLPLDSFQSSSLREGVIQSNVSASSVDKDFNVHDGDISLATHYPASPELSEGQQLNIPYSNSAVPNWSSSVNDQSQDDWDLFMANVDQLLEIVNSQGF